MSEAGSIGIIGAGITGLACAAKLAEAGLNPVVIDKGRGIGGRLATRRSESGLQFDHGAQYLDAATEGFQAVLDEAVNAGKVKVWDIGSPTRYVGIPGMNGLAKHLGEGLDIRFKTAATGVRDTSGGSTMLIDDQALEFEKLVITVPAPQALALLPERHTFRSDLLGIEMLPCLTLMAAFDGDRSVPFKLRQTDTDVLSSIALDSSKPKRPGQTCWVAQASSAWSIEHLEEPTEHVAELMLPLLCDEIGVSASTLIHMAAHRWRYAKVSNALGRPFLHNEYGTLYVGGDWCLGSTVETAWTSGVAIAKHILSN
ncbi:MAG: FAD-dependent oxidoreductase [Pseudomonadota bacterium]